MHREFEFMSLIGMEIFHTAPGYGQGAISKMYIKDEGVSVEISFVNGRNTTSFSLGNCLQNGLFYLIDPDGNNLSLSAYVADNIDAVKAAIKKREQDVLDEYYAQIEAHPLDEIVQMAKECREKISDHQEKYGAAGCNCPPEYRKFAEKALDYYSVAFNKASKELGDGSTAYEQFCRKNCAGVAACYRNLGEPEKVVQLLYDFGGVDSRYLAASFFVSLSAAYCDLNDTESARLFYSVAARRYDAVTPQMEKLYHRIVALEIEKEVGLLTKPNQKARVNWDEVDEIIEETMREHRAELIEDGEL